MRAPLGWLRDWVALPPAPDGRDMTGRELAEKLIAAGLEVETVERAGSDVTGPLVLGRVLGYEVEQHSNGKSIRWCRVDVGPEHNGPEGWRGIVCGAHNFAVWDIVVVALPGAVLPGPFEISARKTYGHVSDGMICSARELGLGDDHTGILVLKGGDLVPGTDAAEALQLRDDVLDIAVTPDRGYCLSIRGLAREAAQATGVAFTDPVDRPTPAQTAAGYPVRLDSAACPLFAAVSVTGIDPSRPSPRWLSRRVQLAGMRSISLVVDITNYVMLETGQPIHAYDADRLAGAIVVRQAAAGEKLTTLDDVARDLDQGDLLITDDSGPIGLAGVMGGATTEISATTTSVVIEAAHFDAMTIARTSRRHKLSSEASRRFERGVDPAAAYAAAHRVASLLVELAGGTLVPAETVAGALPPAQTTTLHADLPERILGTPVDGERAAELIRAVGARVELADSTITATAPSWRPDLRDPYDYVEEVGRLIGYETIEAVVPRAPVGRGLTRVQRARRAVNAALASSGFVEVLSFPFAAEADLERLGLAAGDVRRDLVRILNPLAETSPYLRSTLLPGLFAAVNRNTSRGNDDLALYEAGSVFRARRPVTPAPRPSVTARPAQDVLDAMDDALPDQPRQLAVVLTGNWRPASWQGGAEKASWTHAVGFVETAAAALGATLVRSPARQAPWHPGRCAEFRFAGDEQAVGYAGELHPSVCAAFGLPARTCAAELDLDALIAGAPAGGDVAAISSFPVAKEDVALIVDAAVSAADVEAELRAGAGELLESVRLFDIYTGPQIGEGKKSLAFALRFRAAGRTLTDAETAAARDAAVARTVAAFGAIQRTD
ncbi:phenylalanine--tRNA ligase subunit beta [Microlunatus ginsengisoli]|uniref:Phenylalanine--tRNA ligase beta subunit n=1 Tax=Microlunatus ginsengisoli TaxID=363863 RepID=A0ABP6ZAY5_9ACTN